MILFSWSEIKRWQNPSGSRTRQQFSTNWQVLNLTARKLDWSGARIDIVSIGSPWTVHICVAAIAQIFTPSLSGAEGIESWTVSIYRFVLIDKPIFERENTVWWGMLIIYTFLDMCDLNYEKSTAPVSSMEGCMNFGFVWWLFCSAQLVPKYALGMW